MEIWDAYKKDGSPANCDLIRGKAIPEGLYHLVCEVLVKHTDGSYLLMQRDFNKEGYPGMFESTAGGSALKGETPFVGAMRELREETGIATNALQQIYYSVGNHTIYYGFLCVTDCAKSSVTLQEGETIDYVWLTQEEFLQFIHTDRYIQEQKDRLTPYLQTLV